MEKSKAKIWAKQKYSSGARELVDLLIADCAQVMTTM